MPFTLMVNECIVVKRAAAAEQTAEGVVHIKKRPRRGEVVAIRRSMGYMSPWDESYEIKVGDDVIYANNVGEEFEFCGEEYVVLRENDILVKINK